MMSKPSQSKEKVRKLSWKEFGELIVDSVKEFFAVQGFHHGAAMAYYALFAMVPLLYLTISVFGRFIGKDTMISIISSILKDKIGIQDVSGILEFLQTLNLDKGNLLMEIVGFITLLVTSSAILASMKTSINKFMGIIVTHSAKRILLREVLFRLISLLLIAFFTLVIIIVYFAQSLAVSVGNSLLGDMDNLHWFYQNLLSDGFSFFTNILIFTFVYRYVHDGIVRWRFALVGALSTTVLLYLGQLLIHYYLLNLFFAAKSGIAGSLLIVMVWVFYTSQIIFFGAKYTAVYAKKVHLPILLR